MVKFVLWQHWLMVDGSVLFSIDLVIIIHNHILDVELTQQFNLLCLNNRLKAIL